MGALLGSRLESELAHHPNVADIRGRGLFWGIEFVANKQGLIPFPAEAQVAMRICELGLTENYSINVYPGGGSADGILGDHIIIAPAFNVSSNDIEFIVVTVARLVGDFFVGRE
jgi:adenosylmethionine-8-amino-7-oxononanoate aminotransferase